MNTVKNKISDSSRALIHIAKIFIKWIVISLIIGVIGGFIGSAFYLSIAKVTDIRANNPWFVYLLPIAGLAIAVIYKIAHDEKKTTNTIISSILNGENVPVSLTPVIFISTVLTHLCGGSAGREGAALQIGGSIGCNIGSVFKLDEKEERLAILSGMSAVFSALFGTPITAVIFALEVCSVGIIHYSGLLPCGIAAMTAFAITRLFGIIPSHFDIITVSLSYSTLFKVVLFSSLVAFLSELFCKIMHHTARIAAKLIKNTFIRIFVGGLIIILLTLIVGNQDYNGGGLNVIHDALIEGTAKPFAFLLKILFTCITLSFGFKGGEIVPTFFIGATFGCIAGPLFGLDSCFAASIGLIAMFCGAVNCPLASLVLSIELFGSNNFIYFAFACFISYVLSGYSGLYSEQKIVYSKIKTEFINRRVE